MKTGFFITALVGTGLFLGLIFTQQQLVRLRGELATLRSELRGASRLLN